MSTRLTNKIRSQIVSAVSTAKFDHLIESAEKVLNRAIKERMDQSQAASIPSFLINDDWIKTTDQFMLRLFRKKEDLENYLEGKGGNFDLVFYEAKDLAYPVKASEHRTTINIWIEDPEDQIAIAYKKYSQEKEAKKRFERDIDKVISSATTVSALLKLMPELEPYIPTDVGLPNLDLVPADLINRVRRVIKEA